MVPSCGWPRRRTCVRKVKAWRTAERRPSKALKDLGDIARLIEARPALLASLRDDVRSALDRMGR
jgi:hypothetical protein